MKVKNNKPDLPPRIKEVAKLYGVSIQSIADSIGVTRQALHKQMNGNPSIVMLESIAKAIGCNVIELMGTDSQYSHFYDINSKEWLGIRKK